MSKKQLNLFDLVMIVVALVIGMGIFRTPTVVANRTGTPTLFFLAWIIGGGIALCGGLTYAEIGSRYPVTGGYYKVFSYGYHPSLAFAINCIILVSNAGSMALVGVIGAEYIGYFFYGNQPTPELFRQLVTTAAVTFFFCINLLALLLTSVFGHHPVVVHAAAAPPGESDSGGWLKALAFGMVAVSFTYGGYQQTINFGGDVRDASRIMPRGIATGVVLIILLYLAINFVYVRVIGFDHLKSADSIAATLMDHLFGAAGDRILRILMFLSVLAYVNVSVMSNPRVMYAMSEEGILPAIFGKRTAKHDVIIWSLTAYSAAICLTLLVSSQVEKILNYTIFLDSIGFATSASTIFILRRRKVREDQDIYRIKWFPFVPAILILAYIGIAISVVWNDPHSALFGAGIFAIFFSLYFVLRARKGRVSRDPPAPVNLKS
jgi:basic amino acid/polyamine antiporter, APA family